MSVGREGKRGEYGEGVREGRRGECERGECGDTSPSQLWEWRRE